MIDLATENVLSLTDAAKRLPQRRAGKRPHVATLYRWASRGIRNAQLETIQIGGTMCTSMEALQRFFDRLSTQITMTSNSHSGSESSRKKALDATSEQLREQLK